MHRDFFLGGKICSNINEAFLNSWHPPQVLKGIKTLETNQVILFIFHHSKYFISIPFVVFTVEKTIEDITQRAHMMKVIKNYYNRELYTIIIRTALFSQVSKILLQLLGKKIKETNTSMIDLYQWQAIHSLGIAHFVCHPVTLTKTHRSWR